MASARCHVASTPSAWPSESPRETVSRRRRSTQAVAASLEAKLKSFEATPEEERAATLGGMIPGSSGTDAFDISLYLAAIPLFGSLALFLFFPAIAPMLAGSDLPPPSA